MGLTKGDRSNILEEEVMRLSCNCFSVKCVGVVGQWERVEGVVRGVRSGRGGWFDKGRPFQYLGRGSNETFLQLFLCKV